jgi:hypothetical protein
MESEEPFRGLGVAFTTPELGDDLATSSLLSRRPDRFQPKFQPQKQGSGPGVRNVAKSIIPLRGSGIGVGE